MRSTYLFTAKWSDFYAQCAIVSTKIPCLHGRGHGRCGLGGRLGRHGQVGKVGLQSARCGRARQPRVQAVH